MARSQISALVIGGATIDTLAVIASEKIERMQMQNADQSFLLLEEGRKAEATDISTHCGGGGVNVAVALARLGYQSSALVRIGNDDRGRTILQRLAEESVSTRFVARDSALPTGASVLVASHERNAAIFTFRGANTRLTLDDAPEAAFDVDLVYIAGLSSESASAFPGLVARAKAGGAKVCANPGIRQLSARGSDLTAVLPDIDILTLNRAEAEALTPMLVGRFGETKPTIRADESAKVPARALRDLSSGGHDMRLAAFFRNMHALGLKHVLLTDGRHGAFLSVQGGDGVTITHCPALMVKVAGTAGAGDAFAGTFAAAFVRGDGIERALRSAALNAASVVSYVDTQTGLLKATELTARLERNAGDLTISVMRIKD